MPISRPSSLTTLDESKVSSGSQEIKNIETIYCARLQFPFVKHSQYTVTICHCLDARCNQLPESLCCAIDFATDLLLFSKILSSLQYQSISVALFVGTHLSLLVFRSTQQMAHDFRLAGTEAQANGNLARLGPGGTYRPVVQQLLNLKVLGILTQNRSTVNLKLLAKSVSVYPGIFINEHKQDPGRAEIVGPDRYR